MEEVIWSGNVEGGVRWRGSEMERERRGAKESVENEEG